MPTPIFVALLLVALLLLYGEVMGEVMEGLGVCVVEEVGVLVDTRWPLASI
jgi:hypothetical protein